MAGKERTTATGSLLHDESPSPDPNLAGKSESRRRRQGKTQKVQSSWGLICRRCLWYPSGQNLLKRGNKTAKKTTTSDSNFLENDGHNSSSKEENMGKPPDLRTSSSLEDIIIAENKKFKDYHKPPDTLPSWRPPVPEDDDIWVPSQVGTNGEGREKLEWKRGDPLVEVFDIKVDLRGMRKTCGNIHGSIRLDCYAYAVDLFNCSKDSSVMIKDKGSLPLKSPEIALLGYEPIGFIFNLKIDDDKLCNDILVWDPTRRSRNEWMFDTAKGKKGKGNVHVTYLVMRNSWLAELDVKLIKPTKETSSKIRGNIVVYDNNMSYLRYFIFNKGVGDYSTVNALEPIPLSRSLFACHHASSLVVKVDLWDSETNQALARGALSFSPEYYGDSVGTVPDPHGIVQVTVNWQRYRTHSKSVQFIEHGPHSKPATK